ncbi:cation:proton antiporter [Salipaludibacillus aurantiacus]|uniref:Monovalent cation:H+ antiporter, CPA1 family n=1 Tax=Salipaludibacillus aurantiacus TaxID=1601833 RepID=A0A1H9UP43_9BACI|nr:sodium:proton antiporter [Salipaludibacillus aurantiacus]SES11071.1 monovalent cation:H+ antiporter, CPA1 family [Salipaludibacillus aurantiacus]
MSVSITVFLLFIGYIIFSIDKKKENFPVPPILVIIGIGLFFVPYFSQISVTKEIIYHVFLPGLLFVSAYQFPFSDFKRYAGIITFLSTAGILLTVLLLGTLIYAVSLPFIEIPFIGALLMAAILTPTDPVSVVSVLKKSADDDLIADVVEGESLLNDGTSIVLFTFISGIYLQTQSISPMAFIGEFLYVSLGGIALGGVFGWLFSQAIHYTHNKEYQVMLSIILAYGSFNLAEFLGVSGVLATVFAGIMLSFEFGRAIREAHFREALDGFWGVIEISILSLLFLLIGILAADYLIFNYWGLAVLVFAGSLIVRLLVIAGATQLLPVWHKKMSMSECVLVSWSGLKGSVSIFLILSLKATGADGIDLIISLTFAVVLISLVVQSIGVHPLSKKLLG